MSLKIVKYELEAKLTTDSGGRFSKPSGKIERKSYGDGRERLKISVRNLKVPDRSTAIVKADDREIAQIPLVDGSGHIDNESDDSSSIPTLQVGQAIEILVDDTLILSGKLYVD
ncbi:MAG: hypothetical protein OEQ39_17950 [Gammaproteobacteria bacterium]|nr:hypothetical protein [Gammaproteobacteria bacterium]MDH3467245.1 hypothetical protein [Gammaproteobacteria bacterium]